MIPLAIPNLAGNERAYLDDCVTTNLVSSIGPFVGRFEEAVAAATGAPAAVATSSGTTALHLALVVVGVRPGDLVLLPDLTFIASANAISACAAEPWLVDIDLGSWTIDPTRLAEALAADAIRTDEGVIHRPTGRRVAAILPVHALGLPADMDAINAIAESYGLPVVADAAAAIGGSYRGRAIGGLATLSALSFNGNKTFTCGGGGAIVGSDEQLLARAKHLSTTARTSSAYDHDEVGFNYRMTNVQAAIGVAQLEQAEAFLRRKHEIARCYQDLAASLAGVSAFPRPAWAVSADWLSGIVLDDAQVVPEFTARVQALGVEARTFWKPMHLQKPYRDCPQGSLDVSSSVWSTVVTLPSSTSITDDELDQVCAAVRAALS